MRIRIDHSTTYAYDRPARFIVQSLRMAPRSSESQQVIDWRVETDIDTRLRTSDDAFGNIVHTLYTEAPTRSLRVRVSGEVLTRDTHGVLVGWPQRLSPTAYLRTTPLTMCDAGLTRFAQGIPGELELDRLHALMAAIHADIAFEVGTTSTTHTAAEVFAQKRGVCQDHAHVFIATARKMGIPARYVSGHLARSDGAHDQDAAHAWAEAYVEPLGWVGFDPANGISPTERYVRIASGLDYLGAAPVRGAAYGGGRERMSVKLNVRDMRETHTQSQSQQQA